LFDLAPIKSIYIKLTPRIMNDSTRGTATPETLFPKLAFGARQPAWGSNDPTSPGNLREILKTAQDRLAMLPDEDRGWIFAGTARKLYPRLNG
jgi:L-fuconolactonase